MSRLGRRGAAAVEFALVTPVFVALSCAIADWCWFVYCQTTVQDIAFRAARAGALADPRDTPTPAEVAEQEARTLLAEAGFDTVATVVTAGTTDDGYGWNMDIEVHQPYDAPSPVTSAFLTLELVGRSMVHGELSP